MSSVFEKNFFRLSDAEQRRLFVSALDQDFSVIAPAGVGKTHALVERVVRLVQQQPQVLPNLYVITYTKKAAVSLKVRAQERLRTDTDRSRALWALQPVFFGTTHSLAWQLIQRWDPTSYEYLPEDSDCRNDFLRSFDFQQLPEKFPRVLFRFIEVDTLLQAMEGWHGCENDLGKRSGDAWLDPAELAAIEKRMQQLDLSPILEYQPTTRHPKALEGIEKTKQSLRRWWEAYQQGEDFLSLPECLGGGEAFRSIFEKTFRPFYQSLGRLAMACGQYFVKRSFDFRREKGYLTHTDVIRWVQQVIQTPDAKNFYAQHPISILLDEAQDTDVAQFHFLKTWLSMHPKSHFSMVGDPQQSIYERADVSSYVQFHQTLVQEKRCQPLIFSKTFRCPSNIVSVLNAHFPKILSRQTDALQVDYVPLQSAAKTEGSFQEICVPFDGSMDPVEQEARAVSDFLKTDLQNRPRALSDICFLSPRKDWLQAFQQALSNMGWKMQLHSQPVTGRDCPLFCHVLAMIHEVNFPEDTFEKVGLLQTTFGCSTEALTWVFEKRSVQKQPVTKPLPSSLQTVKAAQAVLDRLIQETAALSLCAGVTKLLTFFQPRCETTPTDAYFTDLLLKTAFQTQQKGQSWFAFETYLRPYLHLEAEEEVEIQSDALQGFSCHKAKGLEWETVVLPFFYRPIHPPSASYPRVVRNQFLWRAEDAKEMGDFDEYRRECQRLLYVACTRAKQHLWVLQDAALWESEKKSFSFGSLLEAV